MRNKLMLRVIRSGASCLGFILSLSLCALQAQTGSQPASRFVFPRFVSYDNVSTGIAVFNPSVGEAGLTLTLKGFDGLELASTSLAVPPLGQIAKTAGQLFPALSSIDASLTITSATPGLVAYYETFDKSLSFIDGTEASSSAFDLLFPVVPESSGAIELDLLNTNSRPTNTELKLWSLGGALLGKAVVQVPAGGIYANLATGIFAPGTSFSAASHITASSKNVNIFSPAQSIYGTSLIAGPYPQLTAGGGIDIAAANALPLTQLSNAGVIPYFRTGGKYASTLSIANIEPVSVNVTLTAIRNDGTTLGVGTASINSNGGFRGALQSIFPALEVEPGEGWILLQASGRVQGTMLYGGSETASLSAVPMQAAPRFAFGFPQVVQNSGSTTELTLVNPSSNTSYADVFVAQPDGTTVASTRMTMAPGTRVSRSLDQYFPDTIDLPGGYLYVRSSEPLFSGVSIWDRAGATLSYFAPQTVANSFSPLPQKSFVIGGTVTINGEPAEGFRIVLSGPVGALATTAGDGSYLFENLPAGKYSIAIDQVGFLFVPPEVNLELTTASKRQDFAATTPGNGIAFSPPTAPVHSPDTTVTVYGRDFNRTSQAYAGPVLLDTALIDSTRLQVVIPAYMLALPAQLDIYVVTNDSGSDRRVTQTSSFIVFQDRPTLTSVTSSTEIVERGPGTTLTLQGTGFFQDAVVKINSLSDNIQVTIVDDTQIVAMVPPSYFTHGGIFPVTVQNPYPANVESNMQLLTVYYPAPAVENVTPGSVPARLEKSAGPLPVEVWGYGFRRGAQVLVNGEPVPTTYCENDDYCLSVHMFAQVPVDFLRESGYLQITAQNPIPALPSTEAALLRIDGLEPAITSVLPGSATVTSTPFNFVIPLVINGTNFGTQTKVRVYKEGTAAPDFSDAEQLLSSTQLLASVETDYLNALGEWTVEVANPPPGGGQSDRPYSFFISPGNFAGNPFLISLSPQMVQAGGPGFTLIVNGSNFKSGSQLYFNMTSLATVVTGDKQLRAEVPAYLIQTAGKFPVSVINPDTGGASNRLFLDVK